MANGIIVVANVMRLMVIVMVKLLTLWVRTTDIR